MSESSLACRAEARPKGERRLRLGGVRLRRCAATARQPSPVRKLAGLPSRSSPPASEGWWPRFSPVGTGSSTGSGRSPASRISNRVNNLLSCGSSAKPRPGRQLSAAGRERVGALAPVCSVSPGLCPGPQIIAAPISTVIRGQWSTLRFPFCSFSPIEPPTSGEWT
jgi:hypothetical protein